MLDKQKALLCQRGQAQDLLLPLQDPPALTLCQCRWFGRGMPPLPTLLLAEKRKLQTEKTSNERVHLCLPLHPLLKCGIMRDVPAAENAWNHPGIVPLRVEAVYPAPLPELHERKGRFFLCCCCFNAQAGFDPSISCSGGWPRVGCLILSRLGDHISAAMLCGTAVGSVGLLWDLWAGWVICGIVASPKLGSSQEGSRERVLLRRAFGVGF